MANNTNVMNISDLTAFKSRHREQIKQQLCERSRNLLTASLRSMLDEADDTLFDFSSNADTNLAQQGYLDAMREVRLKRNKIEQGYFIALNTAFEDFDKHKQLPAAMQASNGLEVSKLELIDDESIEENMAVHNMAEKLGRSYPQEIFEVDTRIKALYNCHGTDGDIHPLSPATISISFASALKPLDIEFHVKLIIFKLFDKFVMSNMGKAYKELNTLLINNKVLPNLQYQYKRSTSTYRPRNNQNKTEAYHCRQSDENHDWETVENLNTNHNNISDTYHAGDTANNLMPMDFGLHGFTAVPVRSGGVIGTLNAMQNHIGKQGLPSNLRPAELGKQFIQDIHKIGFASVSGTRELDDKTITMVSMIFDFILDDPSVPEPIKNLLTRLQIPYLKIALLDDKILEDAKHPARKLLNDMARASIGWHPASSKQDLYSLIEGIVDTILNDFEQDIELFKRLQVSLKDYCEREKSVTKSHEARTWKTTAGKERVQYAKKRVDAWIHMWCSKPQTRKQVATFLKHFWKNTMLYCMHKYGEDSREWRYYIKIINTLIWSTTQEKNGNEVRQLIKITPLLIRGLNRGLLAVATHPNTISKLFREFSKCHLEIIEKGLEQGNANTQGDLDVHAEQDDEIFQHNSVEETVEKLYEPGAQAELDKPELEVDEDLEALADSVDVSIEPPKSAEHQDALIDEFHELASQLEYGHWLELTIADKPIVAKLAWKSSITSNHLFVGRDGVRVAEISLSDIAQSLRNGSARVFDQRPVFERALQSLQQDTHTQVSVRSPT